jgi:hypothetical protein
VRRSLLLLALILAAWSPRAIACSCAGIPVKLEKKNASLVFVGRVSSRDIPEIDLGDARALMQPGLDLRAKVSFEVLQAWSYDAPRTVEAFTPMSGGSCGYLPDPGTAHVIFAYRRTPDVPFQIHVCSNNAAIERAEAILEELGRPAVRYQPLTPDADAAPGAWPVYRLGGRVKAPVRISRSDAEVSPDAPCRGNVVMRLVVDSSGRVVEVEDLNPRPDAFTRAYAAAARKWTYRPARLRGSPVAVEIYSQIHVRCR